MKEDNLYERYNRQIILTGFGTGAQLKLVAARVLLVGAGGLGCPALQYLVGAGVGTIGIIDHDVVTLSNLHRQVLYNTDDIGKHKATAAAEKLRRVNPDVTIHSYTEQLDNNNALALFSRYDLVIDGTDNFATRYVVNDACVLLQLPLIYGAVSRYEGQVAVFNVGGAGGRGVNYRDLFPEAPVDGEIMNCATGGVLGMLPGIIGTMQAAEAIKLLTGIGKPLINQLLTLDILTQETYTVELTTTKEAEQRMPPDAETFRRMDYAAACTGTRNEELEINPDRFHQLRAGASAIVIDVREKGETPDVRQIPHVQMPMSQFNEQMNSIEAHTVLLFCQHGVRSLYAAEMLQDAFGDSKQVYSLKGGVVKWGAELGAINNS